MPSSDKVSCSDGRKKKTWPYTMLRRRAEFVWLQQHGKRLRSQYHTVLWHHDHTMETMHVGFTVSKKVGKAVVRQRVKRRLREMFRLQLPHLKGVRLICIAHAHASTQTYQRLLRDLEQLTGRIEGC